MDEGARKQTFAKLPEGRQNCVVKSDPESGKSTNAPAEGAAPGWLMWFIAGACGLAGERPGLEENSQHLRGDGKG